MDNNKENSGERSDKKGGEGQVSLEDIQKRLKELETSNQRLVDESKNYKKRAQEAETKLEEFEKKKAQESGDIAKQLEMERKEKEKLANDNKSLKGKTLRNNIRETVSKFAKDVHDIEDFLNQPKFYKIIEDGIDTENLTVSEQAAKDYVNKVLEAKPWLRKVIDQADVDTSKPKPKGQEQVKDYSKMSSKEILEDIKKNHA